MNSMRAVLELCHDKYDQETFEHAMTVARYTRDNKHLNSWNDDDLLYCFALCHDLLEDTDVSYDAITEAFSEFYDGYGEITEKRVLETLKLLTKDKNEKYNDYIGKIKCSDNDYAYAVKIADIKDHLSRTETLTDKLKEKYLSALAILL